MFYYKKMHPDAQAPKRKHKLDAGFDLHSVEDSYVEPGRTVRVKTGIAIEIGEGNVGLICGRSGLAASGIDVIGGVVDAGYSGEISVCLANHGEHGMLLEKGDRIAQIVPMVLSNRTMQDELTELSELDFMQGERGENGFGSSGK